MKAKAWQYIVGWGITVIALYFAFRSIEWDSFIAALSSADLHLVFLALLLTISSYLMRARRWQFLFGESPLAYFDAVRVLFLGFFMNNVFPARAGEIVRAHMGSKVSGERRSFVLATVAAERLADGVTLSLLFALCAVGVRSTGIAKELLYVAALFGVAGVAVGLVLALRTRVYRFLHWLESKFQNKYSSYFLSRVEVFLKGLEPLCTPKMLAGIVIWSIVVWGVELLAYVQISKAFGVSLSFSSTVLFLVAVNFSSLVPLAPGAIGVIEAFASAALVAVGIDRELALAMVVTQHMMQYVVVGLPGAFSMLTWRKQVDVVS